MRDYSKEQEVFILETYSGIVIAAFWWAIGNIHVDMVFNDDGQPGDKTWNPTSCWREAYMWNSKPAAYKYLRENPDLAALGYKVYDLADLNWPTSVIRDPRSADQAEGGGE